MSNDLRDDGPTADQLGVAGWLLGLLSLGGFVRLLAFALDTRSDVAEMLAWAVVTVVLCVFAATCAALAGVKRSESRLRGELQYLAHRPVDRS